MSDEATTPAPRERSSTHPQGQAAVLASQAVTLARSSSNRGLKGGAQLMPSLAAQQQLQASGKLSSACDLAAGVVSPNYVAMSVRKAPKSTGGLQASNPASPSTSTPTRTTTTTPSWDPPPTTTPTTTQAAVVAPHVLLSDNLSRSCSFVNPGQPSHNPFSSNQLDIDPRQLLRRPSHSASGMDDAVARMMKTLDQIDVGSSDDDEDDGDGFFSQAPERAVKSFNGQAAVSLAGLSKSGRLAGALGPLSQEQQLAGGVSAEGVPAAEGPRSFTMPRAVSSRFDLLPKRSGAALIPTIRTSMAGRASLAGTLVATPPPFTVVSTSFSPHSSQEEPEPQVLAEQAPQGAQPDQAVAARPVSSKPVKKVAIQTPAAPISATSVAGAPSPVAVPASVTAGALWLVTHESSENDVGTGSPISPGTPFTGAAAPSPTTQQLAPVPPRISTHNSISAALSAARSSPLSTSSHRLRSVTGVDFSALTSPHTPTSGAGALTQPVPSVDVKARLSKSLAGTASNGLDGLSSDDDDELVEPHTSSPAGIRVSPTGRGAAVAVGDAQPQGPSTPGVVLNPTPPASSPTAATVTGQRTSIGSSRVVRGLTADSGSPASDAPLPSPPILLDATPMLESTISTRSGTGAGPISPGNQTAPSPSSPAPRTDAPPDNQWGAPNDLGRTVSDVQISQLHVATPPSAPSPSGTNSPSGRRRMSMVMPGTTGNKGSMCGGVFGTGSTLGASGAMGGSGRMRRASALTTSALLPSMEVQRGVGISIDPRLSMMQVERMEHMAALVGITGVDDEPDARATPLGTRSSVTMPGQIVNKSGVLRPAAPSRSGVMKASVGPPKPADGLQGLECIVVGPGNKQGGVPAAGK